MRTIQGSRQLSVRLSLGAAAIGAWLAAAPPAHAVLSIFETPGLTQGDDAVECTDQGTYRYCPSDAGTERILSHDGLAPGQRIPLDFHLYLPPAPASGLDGLYPLVVFIHGWGGSRCSSSTRSACTSRPTTTSSSS